MCFYSLIIPVYQVKEYITDCLESIFCQIPVDVQVILVDDGSTDGSGEICDEYSRKYPQIEVIHQENQGVAAARNAGLAAAKGEYLIWVDPDDWVAEDWFDKINQVICSQKPDILLFDYMEMEDCNCLERVYGRGEGWLDQDAFLRDVIKDSRQNSSLWNKVLRKSIFKGIRFCPDLLCLEDYAVLHRLIMVSKSIYYLPESLYVYRIRRNGLVRTLNLDVAFQSFLVALQRKTDIEQSGRKCSAIGSIKQAVFFCRNYYRSGFPKEFQNEYMECRSYIIRHVTDILLEKELGIMEKIKWIVFASEMGGRIFAKIRQEK